MKNYKIPAKYINLVTLNKSEGLSDKEVQEYKSWLDKNNFDFECMELDYTLLLPKHDFGTHDMVAEPYLSETNDMNDEKNVMVINVRHIDDIELEQLGMIERVLNLSEKSTGLTLEIFVPISTAFIAKKDGTATMIDLSNKSIEETTLLLSQTLHQLHYQTKNASDTVEAKVTPKNLESPECNSLFLGKHHVIHRIDSLGIYALEDGSVANLLKYQKDTRCFKDEGFVVETRQPTKKEAKKIAELKLTGEFLD